MELSARRCCAFIFLFVGLTCGPVVLGVPLPNSSIQYGAAADVSAMATEFSESSAKEDPYRVVPGWLDENPFAEPMLLQGWPPFTEIHRRFLPAKFHHHFRQHNCAWSRRARWGECRTGDEGDAEGMLTVPEPMGMTAFGFGLIFGYQALKLARRKKRSPLEEENSSPVTLLPELELERRTNCRSFLARQKLIARRSRMAA